MPQKRVPEPVGGGGRLVNIPLTSLANGSEIQQKMQAPPSGFSVVGLGVLDGSDQTPGGLDVYVYDIDSGVEIIRSNSAYESPDGASVPGGNRFYCAVENATGGEVDASGFARFEEA